MPPSPNAVPLHEEPALVVLQLEVRNHPGTLSHVAGLFARRAFNLEAVRVDPIGDGSTSQMVLHVKERRRLHQVIAQISKLEDVLSVEQREDA